MPFFSFLVCLLFFLGGMWLGIGGSYIVPLMDVDIVIEDHFPFIFSFSLVV